MEAGFRIKRTINDGTLGLFEFITDVVELVGTGREERWCVVSRPTSMAIIAISPTGCFLLHRSFRRDLGREVWSVPAADTFEGTPESCARQIATSLGLRVVRLEKRAASPGAATFRHEIQYARVDVADETAPPSHRFVPPHELLAILALLRHERRPLRGRVSGFARDQSPTRTDLKC